MKDLSLQRRAAIAAVIVLVALFMLWGLRILGKGALFQNLERQHLENVTRIEAAFRLTAQGGSSRGGIPKSTLYQWIDENIEYASHADSEVFSSEQIVIGWAGFADVFLLPRQSIIAHKGIRNAIQATAGDSLTPEIAQDLQKDIDYIYTISRQFVVAVAAALEFVKNTILAVGLLGLAAWFTMERLGREKEMAKQRQYLEELVATRTDELVHSNHKLSQALLQLTQTQHELLRRDKLAALGALVNGVAHELNTPIGNGLVAASTLADHTDKFAQNCAQGITRGALQNFVTLAQTASDLIVRSLTRCAELIRRFKEVAVEQTHPTRAEFDLIALLQQIQLPTHAPDGVSLQLDTPATLQMESYPSTLIEVVDQLVQNALVHGYAGQTEGTVWVRAQHRSDDTIELTIEDHGVGIAASDLPRIFDPFFSTRFGTGSSGLGLYITYNMVHGILGGEIVANSQVGGSTRFVMTLPRKAPSANDAAAPL